MLPTTLPIAISYSPFAVAVTEVTNSGKLVPRAIIVSDIILSLIPNILAIVHALSTTKLLPNTIPNNPIIDNNIDFFIEIFFSSSFVSVLFLAILIK